MTLRGRARASLARTPHLAAPEREPHWGSLPFSLRLHRGGPPIDGAVGDLFTWRLLRHALRGTPSVRWASAPPAASWPSLKKELETSTFGLE
jgi:hypothetical protein